MVSQLTSLEAVKASRDWWTELGNKIGWKLYGWTDFNSAHFLDSNGGSIYLNELQAKDLRKALEVIDNLPV